MKHSFTIAYYIFNKGPFIGRIVECLRRFEGFPLIVFFDGCTDDSVSQFMKYRTSLKNCRVFVNGPYDLFETRCNNFLLKTFETDCCILCQDDMLPENTKFIELADKIMLSDARAGLIGFKDGYEMKIVSKYEDFVCAPWSFSKFRDKVLMPGEYHKRTFVNRGPLCISRKVVEKIGLLDERFAPLFWDDNDYSLRAVSAGLNNYIAYSEVECRPEWGATRSGSKIPCKQVFVANQTSFAWKWGRPNAGYPAWKVMAGYWGSYSLMLRYKLMAFLTGQKIVEV